MNDSWGWRHRPLRAWPGELPEGAGGAWAGWSTTPEFDTDWNPAMRNLVSKVLLRQHRDAGLEVPDSFASLQDAQCRIVTVGHQLVVAGGPAFFHHKILTAIRVAKQLSLRENRPVVPLFWMASEDHDWQEVAHVYGASARHSWKPAEVDVPRPVGSLSPAGLAQVIETWKADGVPNVSGQGIFEDVQQAVAKGETAAGVARRWLHRWYGESGLLVLDPMDTELKKAASDLWAAEFEGRGVSHVLKGRPEGGGPAHVRENNVFWMDANAGRVGVVPDSNGGVWRAGEKQWDVPKEGWTSWSKDCAAHCSPGVLLRPLYQELLLESAAVILGPGEWRYWHQLPRVFEHHNLAFPALRIRDHAVVTTSESRAVGWDLECGWMHDEEWDKWVLDRWMEPFQTQLAELIRMRDSWTAQVQLVGREVSPTLDGASGALSAAAGKSLDQWLKKMRRALKSERQEEWDAARRACGTLMRKGVPQDRWAHWHVLAGSDRRLADWNKAWLNAEGGLEARVWVFEPLEGKS
ncbi:MAG: bacillithiol biosynthesis protein BshC [Flavobacteriales bacterium]